MARIASKGRTHRRLTAVLIGIVLLLGACGRPQATAGSIQVDLQIDGGTRTIDIASGSSVQQVLDAAGVEIGALDRVEPPAYTTVAPGTLITVTRVLEQFEIEQIVIPFERQTIRNE
ncbi:MAG: ubiquitin-like domain-containing protein, partial [Anaerolineales bacterium]